jgi:hypothetical protein
MREKLKIDKSFKDRIKRFHLILKTQDKENDKAFKFLCKDMKIKPKSEEADILWDHVFNRSNWMVKYTKV